MRSSGQAQPLDDYSGRDYFECGLLPYEEEFESSMLLTAQYRADLDKRAGRMCDGMLRYLESYEAPERRNRT